MTIEIITVATRPDPGLDNLKKSVERIGAKLTVLGMGEPWLGFKTKLILLRDHLKKIYDTGNLFIFVDAYDVIFTQPLEVIYSKYVRDFSGCIVFSAEKACWPHPELADKYPGWPGDWKYLNSGSIMGDVKMMCDFLSFNNLDNVQDDQLFYTQAFLMDLSGHYGIMKLDYDCEIFQSIAFEHIDDFALATLEENGTIIKARLVNRKTKSYPGIIHGNGKTDMTKFLKLIV